MQVSNPFPAIFSGCILLLSSLRRILQAFFDFPTKKIPRFCWSHPNIWLVKHMSAFLAGSIRFLPFFSTKKTPCENSQPVPSHFPARFWWASWPLSWIQRPCNSWDCARWDEPWVESSWGYGDGSWHPGTVPWTPSHSWDLWMWITH